MASGTIKKLVTDKGFGFIQTADGTRHLLPSFDRPERSIRRSDRGPEGGIHRRARPRSEGQRTTSRYRHACLIGGTLSPRLMLSRGESLGSCLKVGVITHCCHLPAIKALERLWKDLLAKIDCVTSHSTRSSSFEEDQYRSRRRARYMRPPASVTPAPPTKTTGRVVF